MVYLLLGLFFTFWPFVYAPLELELFFSFEIRVAYFLYFVTLLFKFVLFFLRKELFLVLLFVVVISTIHLLTS